MWKRSGSTLLFSQKGLTLTEVLVGWAVLSLTLLAILGVSRFAREQAARRSDLVEFDLFRRVIVELVKHDGSWRSTVMNNASMACLVTPGTACANVGFSAGANPLMALYNGSGGLFYDSRVATNGLTLAGRPCGGFSATAPTPSCPIRLEVRWYAMGGGPSPMIAVYAEFRVSPQTNLSFNSARYAIGTVVGNAIVNPLMRRAQL